MARGKKKEENLTLEERLEQALVPAEEWPYEVPGNWCWVKLPMAFSNRTSSRNKIKQKDYLCRGRFAIVDQGENLIGGFTNDENMLYNGPLPVVIFGDHTRRLKYIDFVFVQGADGVKVLQPRKFYHAKAFYFAMQNIEILNMGYRRHFPLFDKLKIPLPPLTEQKRIIDYIERLFLKLDEVKEKVQCVLESSENRKAAILHKAFSGELTKQWREKNGIGKESWKKLKFYEVAQIKSNLVEPKEYMEYPHIAPDNIEKRSGKLLPYNTIAEDKVFSSKHRFFSGQILYSKIRPYLSKVVLVDFEGLCSADMYPIEAKENVKYLWYYMLSNDFLEQASSAGSRTVLPKINQKELSNLEVWMPGKVEQGEIVKILDKLFPVQELIKMKCEKVITQVDKIKKSILSRAFRGELGTNNPDEESAIELLKTIL